MPFLNCYEQDHSKLKKISSLELQQYLYYCCNQCDYKSQEKDEFRKHLFEGCIKGKSKYCSSKSVEKQKLEDEISDNAVSCTLQQNNLLSNSNTSNMKMEVRESNFFSSTQVNT